MIRVLDRRRIHSEQAGVLLLALILAACDLAPLQPGVPDAPNIILILADDQGWTGTSVPMHDGVPGSKSDFYQTPNLERLAAEGMRFSNAYAPHPNCSPTRASILTGKSPAQLHLTDIVDRNAGPLYEGNRLNPPRHIKALPADEVTLAEVLRNAGYATAHFGKWHLFGGGPGAHGFDVHDGDTGNSGPAEYSDPNPKDIYGITERGMAFMEEQVQAGRPFYLQLSHYAVHLRVRATEARRRKYEALPPGERHADAGYAAMTEDLDAGVGMILDQIDALGIADRTYVIYLSDNGAVDERSDNAPLAGEKASLWEGGIRVPLIIRGPGIAPGTLSHVPVVGYDLFPTIWELTQAGGLLPESVEGGSLAALLRNSGRGAVERPREGLVFHFPHYQHEIGTTPQSSIRAGDYKAILFYETGEVRLYNLAEDVGETRDLAAQMPQRAARLHRRLNAYLAAVEAQMPSPNPDYDPASADFGF